MTDICGYDSLFYQESAFLNSLWKGGKYIVKYDIRKEPYVPGKVIPLKYDHLFARIFNDVKNIDIVEAFIALYLKKPLIDIKGRVEVKPRDLEIASKEEKDKQVDLLLDLDEEMINIEVSNYNRQRIVDRDIVFASKVHGTQLKYGDNEYQHINRTLQIRMNSYHCNKNKLVNTNYFRDDEGNILSKKFQIDIVDLENAKKNIYNEDEEKLARFCKAMLLEDEEEIRKEIRDIMGEEVSEKLIDEMRKYSKDEAIIQGYSEYTRSQLEFNTAMADVREEKEHLEEEAEKLEEQKQHLQEKEENLQEKEGNLQEKEANLQEKEANLQKTIEEKVQEEREKSTYQTKFETAKNLFKNNVDIQIISASTGLSIADIEKLKLDDN